MPSMRYREHICFYGFDFLRSSITHFVTTAIPKRGKLAINRYGNMAKKADGSNIVVHLRLDNIRM
jgi:hypothetical protein